MVYIVYYKAKKAFIMEYKELSSIRKLNFLMT